MKKIVTIIIFALLVFGGFKLVKTKQEDLQNAKTPEIFPLHVDVIQPKNGMLEPKIALIAKLEPSVLTHITSKYASFITSLHVKEGQNVKKGDLLVELDDKELVTKIQSLSYKLDSLRSEIQSAALEEQVIAKKHASNQKLFLAGAISEEQVDDSHVMLQKTSAKKVVLEKSYKQIKAEFDGLEDAMRYYTLRAPMDGIVQKLFVEVGDLCSISKPLIELVSHEKVATFTYDASQKIEKGDRLFIEDITSHVALLEVSAKNYQLEAKSSPFEIDLPNGILIDIFVIKEPITGTLIPKMALYSENQNSFVFEYTENKFFKKQIHVEHFDKEVALVKEPLNHPLAIGSAARLANLSFVDAFIVHEIAYE